MKILKPQTDIALGSQLRVTRVEVRGTGPDHLQKPLPTSAALGFCLTIPQALQERVKLQLKAVEIHLLALHCYSAGVLTPPSLTTSLIPAAHFLSLQGVAHGTATT